MQKKNKKRRKIKHMYSSYGLITPAPVVRYAVEGGHLILLAESTRCSCCPEKGHAAEGETGVKQAAAMAASSKMAAGTHTHTLIQMQCRMADGR